MCPATREPRLITAPDGSCTSCISLPSIFRPGFSSFALSVEFNSTGSAVPAGSVCAGSNVAEHIRANAILGQSIGDREMPGNLRTNGSIQRGRASQLLNTRESSNQGPPEGTSQLGPRAKSRCAKRQKLPHYRMRGGPSNQVRPEAAIQLSPGRSPG